MVKVTDIYDMVESLVKDALIRLNPEIAKKPAYADQVIYKLRNYFLEAEAHNLIDLNERFREFVLEHNSFPFGENGKSVPIQIFGTITKGNADQNEYIVTNQWVYPCAEGGKRLDIVLLVNGIPMVIGELKTPVHEAVTYLDAINDISNYEKSIPKMFTANVFSFASEGKCYRYGSIKSSIEHWGPWFKFNHKKEGTMDDVLVSMKDMLVPEKVMDIFEFYTLFSTSGKDFQKCKIVCRYQQFEGSNAIVNRVRAGGPKKGLIWHEKLDLDETDGWMECEKCHNAVQVMKYVKTRRVPVYQLKDCQILVPLPRKWRGCGR